MPGTSISFTTILPTSQLVIAARSASFDHPGDAAHSVLFQNPGFGSHSLCVQLVGTQSNRHAIGARLRAVVQDGGSERSVFRDVNSGGCFGANPLRQMLGLGKAEQVKTLEVFWPRTGKTQTVADVPADRMIRIVEGKDGYTTVPQTRTVLGGK